MRLSAARSAGTNRGVSLVVSNPPGPRPPVDPLAPPAISPSGGASAHRSSRLPGFDKLSLEDRQIVLAFSADLARNDLNALVDGGLDGEAVDRLIENGIGRYTLPLGLGLNFRINGQDVVAPMALLQPAVVGAASEAALLVRGGGGFLADADEPILTMQVELLGVRDRTAAVVKLRDATSVLLEQANAALPRLVARGGGARGVEARVVGSGDRLVVHLHVDCRDALDLEALHAVGDALSGPLAALTGARLGLRAVTPLFDRLCVRARARVPVAALGASEQEGALVAARIDAASRFAEEDPYRAAAHNASILAGAMPVVLATGNDVHAVGAGVHAFAARLGRYRPLSTWRATGAELLGEVEMPLAVGTIGAVPTAHRGARAALALTKARSARELAMVIASVGLASNLASLRALASDDHAGARSETAVSFIRRHDDGGSGR